MPDLVAGEYTAEGLADALKGWDLSGARVLIPRAELARDALQNASAMKTVMLRALERSIRIDCEESETRALLTTTSGHMKGHAGAADLHYTVGRDSARATFFIKRPGCEPLTAPDDGTFLALVENQRRYYQDMVASL